MKNFAIVIFCIFMMTLCSSYGKEHEGWTSYGGNPQNLRSITTNGEEKNSLALRWKALPKYQFDNEVLISDDKIIIADQSAIKNKYSILCIKSDNGNILWRIETTKSIIRVSIFKNYVYANTEDIFYCIDFVSGKIVWETSLGIEYFNITNNSIYGIDLKRRIISLSPSNGEIVWQTNIPLGKINRQTEYHPDSMILSDDLIAISSFDDDSTHCFDAITGKLKWSFKRYLPLSMACSNKLIASNKDNTILCLNLNTSEVIWQSQDKYWDIVSDGIYLYCESKMGIKKLDIRNGKSLWVFNDVKLNSLGLNLLAGGTLLIQSGDCVIKIDSKTGKMFNETCFGSDIVSNLSYSNGLLFLVTRNGYINCISKSTSNINFKINSNEYETDFGKWIMDTQVIALNNISYIPARFVCEPFGGNIVFDKEESSTHIKLGKKSIIFWKNNPKAFANGDFVMIDPKNPKITPIIKDGRTMVPLRFLAENLGCTVKWVAETKTIIVTYQP